MKIKELKKEYKFICFCGAFFEEPNSDMACPVCGEFDYEENN